ncbi:MAG TPA: hypothetical protein VE093_33170 [Polyangiaceae bacterium]|jgi:hypothetical protein|nr:hypothetical protein [Polyangiaceae bacterium]
MKKALIGFALSMAFITTSVVAAAEPTKQDDSYGYIFKDDALAAETMGAASAQIRVLKLGRRDRLLRPRVHFISEMLKSVENM